MSAQGPIPTWLTAVILVVGFFLVASVVFHHDFLDLFTKSPSKKEEMRLPPRTSPGSRVFTVDEIATGVEKPFFGPLYPVDDTVFETKYRIPRMMREHSVMSGLPWSLPPMAGH